VPVEARRDEQQVGLEAPQLRLDGEPERLQKLRVAGAAG
jgi:hypothetical protein